MKRNISQRFADNVISKIFMLFALLLGTLLFGFVGGTAFAKDPPALKDTYVIDGITYYNVNSSHINSPKLFYEDLLKTPNSSIGGISLAQRWLLLGTGLIEASDSSLLNFLKHCLLGDTNQSNNGYYYSYHAPSWSNNDNGYVETQCYVDNSHGGYLRIYARFYDFSVIALMPGDKDHYISTTIENSPQTSTTIEPTDLGLRNDTAGTATLNASVTNSYTQGFQTSFNHSANYSFKQSLKFATEFDLKIFGSGVGMKFETGLEFGQSFTDGWSKTDTKSKTKTENVGVSAVAQPYTTLLLKKTNTDTTTTTRYNCPVGISYKVVLRCDGNIPVHLVHYNFGASGNAVSDLQQRALVDGVRRTDPESIAWESILEDDIVKKSVQLITTHLPVSATGATTRFNSKTEMYQIQELAPIYPLRYIDLAYKDDAIKNMQVGNYFITDNIKLNGFNEKDGPYYKFKPYGDWIVTDSNGKEIKDGSSAVVLEKDSASGQTKCKAVKGGKAYLVFEIDDKSYPMQTINATKYVTKNDLTKTAVIEINVAEEDVTYEISGNYIGAVNSAPENIEGDEYDGHLAVRAYNKTGKEITAAHIWDAREVSGINLQKNGDVTFTRAGRYHVRAMNQSGTSYSEWKEIYAEDFDVKLGDDKTSGDEEPIPDELRVEANADTYFVIEGSFVGGVTSAEPEKIEGLQKLRVKAYDSTGKEIPLRYTWEGDTTDGMTLSEDGTVSFTKTGLYHVRIKSGEYYSDWTAIQANEFAPARFTHLPTPILNTYNGTAQTLINSDGEYTGGIRIMYGLSSEDVTETTEYNSYIPEAVEVGKYNVWCKVTGDETHTDSEPAYIEAEIFAKGEAPEDPGTSLQDEGQQSGTDSGTDSGGNSGGLLTKSSGSGCNGGFNFAVMLLIGIIPFMRKNFLP